MDRAEIIKQAMDVLLSEFVNNGCTFITCDSFNEDRDFSITAGRALNTRNMYSREDTVKYLNMLHGAGSKTRSMSLTTFDEFDGSCELTYKESPTSKMWGIQWKTSEEMVNEIINTIGDELYDQILAALSINSYDIEKLMRKRGSVNG